MGKNEKEERKKGENCIKNVLKDLKMASYWGINSKKKQKKQHPPSPPCRPP